MAIKRRQNWCSGPTARHEPGDPDLRGAGSSLQALASHEVEDATELAIRVSSACFEFHRGGRLGLRVVGGIQLDSTEFEPVDEQPHAVPAHWFHAPESKEHA